MSVSTASDSTTEQNEFFVLTLSSPTNAILATNDSTATGTINDDGPPAVGVVDATQPEGGSVHFTVLLSTSTTREVTVQYATSSGTATSGTDFTATSGTLTFAAGTDSQTVSVATTNDSTDEENETFTLTLSSPTNATLGANDDGDRHHHGQRRSADGERGRMRERDRGRLGGLHGVTVDGERQGSHGPVRNRERHGDERHRLHRSIRDTHVRGGHGFTDGTASRRRATRRTRRTRPSR